MSDVTYVETECSYFKQKYGIFLNLTKPHVFDNIN